MSQPTCLSSHSFFDPLLHLHNHLEEWTLLLFEQGASGGTALTYENTALVECHVLPARVMENGF